MSYNTQSTCIKTTEGFTTFHTIKGKCQCSCGGSFTAKTFQKHKTTKRCIKHQADIIIKKLKASKTQAESHDAVRNVPEELSDRTTQYGSEQLDRVLKVMFATRDRVGYSKTHQ